jgi:hypothetical protein
MSESNNTKICGIVMPISSIDGCSEGHWSDVLEIITEAVEGSGFEANLVSNSDDVGIIHKRIIQNLYDNPIVICDVSGKNPNVMFELGIRLAFDKPTIIIKDDKTSYSFDTSSIEHLEYPRDLRFTKIVEFKKKLKDKVEATYSKATSDPNYTTFLKHFGEFKVAKLDKKEVSGQEYLLEEMRGLRMAIRRLEGGQGGRIRRSDEGYRNSPEVGEVITICMQGWSDRSIDRAKRYATRHPKVLRARVVGEDGHPHLMVMFSSSAASAEMHELESELERFQEMPNNNAKIANSEQDEAANP